MMSCGSICNIDPFMLYALKRFKRKIFCQKFCSHQLDKALICTGFSKELVRKSRKLLSDNAIENWTSVHRMKLRVSFWVSFNKESNKRVAVTLQSNMPAFFKEVYKDHVHIFIIVFTALDLPRHPGFPLVFQLIPFGLGEIKNDSPCKAGRFSSAAKTCLQSDGCLMVDGNCEPVYQETSSSFFPISVNNVA